LVEKDKSIRKKMKDRMRKTISMMRRMRRVCRMKGRRMCWPDE